MKLHIYVHDRRNVDNNEAEELSRIGGMNVAQTIAEVERITGMIVPKRTKQGAMEFLKKFYVRNARFENKLR